MVGGFAAGSTACSEAVNRLTTDELEQIVIEAVLVGNTA